MPDNGPAPVAIRELAPSEVAEHPDELVNLQRVEAALIGDDRIPQPSKTTAELMAAELTWHVAVEGGAVIAAVATSQCPDGWRDIERLVVAPSHHRRGLASALVRSVSAGATVVATGRDNVPARRLYERLGFHHVEDREIVERLWVSVYEK